MAKAKRTPQKEAPLKRRLETAASLIGALLAAATLSVILYDGMTGDNGPAVISVEALGVHEHEAGFVLEIMARNLGGRTATGVLVEGELRRDGDLVATSELIFDFVPERSKRQGGLFFSLDPRLYELEVRAHGYADP